MQRRTFLIGTGSAAIGGSALLGSGAFSRVESDRAVTIQVAEDEHAYLGLQGCPDSPNQSYTGDDGKGHLTVDMTPENPTDAGGIGVNSDSTSWFHSTFQVCNQGKEGACIYIEDDDDWPVVPEDNPNAGERRVDFYVEDNPDVSIIGEENAIPLPVGECICIGILTRTYSLSEEDRLLEALDDEVTIIADVDLDCGPEALCPDLSGEYECTTYDQENGMWIRTGTRFRVFNDGPVPAVFDIAVADAPSAWREGLTVGANSSRSVISDASVPQNAIIAWDAPEECREIIERPTWGEYKDIVGVENLTDWYESFGTGDAPGDAPEDLDDELIVEVSGIPEVDVDADETVGPDSEIDGELFPSMSEEAEDLGWTTCAALDDH